MRTFIRIAGTAGVLALAAACSDKSKSAMSDDFKKDLERASTASEITLPQAQQSQQVVSAIERTTPPARQVASSQRVAKHKPAPTHNPAPVEVQQAEPTNDVETAPAAPAPEPTVEAPLPSPRPQPVATNGGGSGNGDMGEGRGTRGVGIGDIIGVVLRGGVVDGDDCDPRSEGARRGGILINNRIPVIGTGTFPGSGRIGATVPRGGGFPAGGRRGRF